LKLSPEDIAYIIDQKASGVGSRSIANMLNCSKSAVNYAYQRWLTEDNRTKYGTDYHPNDVAFNQVKLKPRILYLDVETAPDLSVSFGRFKQNMSQDHIITDGGWLISAAWAWNDSDAEGIVLTSEQAKNADDRFIVAVLWELIEQADIVVMQNGDRFDLPVIKARCVINGLPPIKKVKTVDTLKIAKQMKFQSNKLDSLGVFLGVGRKTKHSGISLWVDCMKGISTALKEMLEYNKDDVVLLRDVYHLIKAWDDRAPNMGLMLKTTDVVCRVCGSEDVSATANQVQAGASMFTARSRLRIPNTSKDKRKALLA
jgi:hypothetical protein